jgi:hypothetical protein
VFTNVPGPEPLGVRASTGASVLINAPEPEPELSLEPLPPPALIGASVLTNVGRPEPPGA